jgi:hypothetical protein
MRLHAHSSAPVRVRHPRRNLNGRLKPYAALVALAVIVGAGSSASARSAGGCHPHGSHTIIATPAVRVFKRASRDMDGTFAACLASRGVPVSIDVMFGRATIVPLSPLLGYTTVLCDANSCGTLVELVDLRRPASAPGTTLSVDGTVTELRMRRSGWAAWIACVTHYGNLDVACVPGQRTEVWVGHVHGGKEVRVGTGQHIRARSLRIDGQHVTWWQNGKRKTVRYSSLSTGFGM